MPASTSMAVLFAAFVGLLAAVNNGANAQTYPSGPVKLFVPVPAGGGALTVNFGRSITAFLLVMVLGAGIGGPFYLAFAAFRGVLGNLLFY